MSTSLSSPVDKLSRGLHNNECDDYKSCLDYISTKDDILILGVLNTNIYIYIYIYIYICMYVYINRYIYIMYICIYIIYIIRGNQHYNEHYYTDPLKLNMAFSKYVC